MKTAFIVLDKVLFIMENCEILRYVCYFCMKTFIVVLTTHCKQLNEMFAMSITNMFTYIYIYIYIYMFTCNLDRHN